MKILAFKSKDYPGMLIGRLNKLTTASPLKYPAWKFLSGWGLSQDEKIIRLFHFFEKATEAESAGKFTASSFFWETSLQISKRLKKEDKEDFLKNVFIKCMTGLVNGYAEKSEASFYKERVLYLLQQIETTILLLQPGDSEIGEWLPGIAKYTIDYYDSLNEKKRALNFSELINTIYPENFYFCKRLVALSLDAGIEEMKDENKKSSHNKLASIIKKIENRQFPEPVQYQAYETLGWLYYYYTIKLAEADNVSSALLAVRKAQAYNPRIQNIKESWDTLVIRMNNKKASIAETIRNISYNPNARLTSAGEEIKKDVDVGFTVVNAFIEKQEQAVIHKRENAYLFYLMNRIGVYNKLDEHRIENAGVIYASINRILSDPPHYIREVDSRINEDLKVFPQIDDDTKSKVVDFVKGLLQEGKPVNTIEDEEINAADFYSFTIKPSAGIVKSSPEPFRYWLFSSRDVWTKTIAGFAILLILTIAILYGIQSYSLRERNIAFIEMNNLLKDDGSYSQVLEKASRFLRNKPIFGEDQRTPLVLDTYKQALATWLMTGNLSDKSDMQLYMNQFTKFK